MDLVGDHFVENQNSVYTQLVTLCKLLCVVDPQLYHHLDTVSSLHLLFCYRWILLLFRNELTFEQVQILWEVLWTKYFDKNFHLFVAVALLLQHSEKIITNDMHFEDLMQYFSGEDFKKMELDTVLNIAVELYQHFDKTVSPKIKEAIFGKAQKKN